MAELKKCPFCGGEAEVKSFWFKGTANKRHYFCQCKSCEARLMNHTGYATEERAVKGWNRRRGEVDMTNLRDTVNLMNSEDYKERFIAEYWQTKIRYEKLKAFNTRIEAAENGLYCGIKLEKPKCDSPYSVLRDQQRTMEEYLHLLELRAVFEGIELYGNENCCEGSDFE